MLFISIIFEFIFIFLRFYWSFSNQITGEEKPYDPAWSPSMQAYVFIQFILLLDVYNNLLMEQTVGICFLVFLPFHH